MPSPSTMMAITAGEEEGVAILRKDYPIPIPKEGEVLIRIIYVGQNPPDAFALNKEMSKPYFDPQNILGSDLSGIVIESKSDSIPINSHVFAWVAGATSIQGAYSQFVVCQANMVIRLPSFVSLQSAAAFPFSFFTALHGLQIGLGLNMDPKWLQSDPNQNQTIPVLVWGAGTACGYYALQILRLAGYESIAVTGKKSKQLVESIGVENVYARDTIQQTCQHIREKWSNLYYVLDCHGSTETIDASIRCINQTQISHIHTLLPNKPSFSVPENVKITFDLVHTMTGKRLPILSMVQPNHTLERVEKDHQLAIKWANYDKGLLYRALETKQISLLPVTIGNQTCSDNVEQNMESIRQAIESMAKGTLHSNGKVVYHIQGPK